MKAQKLIKSNWEVGSFEIAQKQDYQELQIIQNCENLYIFKKNFPNIQVKLINPQKMKHGWRLKNIEVCQFISSKIKKNSQSRLTCEKISQTIQFDGQLIITLIKKFNQILCRQISQYVEIHSEQLKEWLQQNIDDIFYENRKSEVSFGFQHSFLKIKSIFFPKKASHYFDYRKFFGQIQEIIIDFQDSENMSRSSKLGDIFQLVFQNSLPFPQSSIVSKQQQLNQSSEFSYLS